MRTFKRMKLLYPLLAVISGFAVAQNGPLCNGYQNKIVDGFSNYPMLSAPHNLIGADGNLVVISHFLAGDGLQISKDGGKTFTKSVKKFNATSLLVDGNRIYVGQLDGISTSLDGGDSFTFVYLPTSFLNGTSAIYADGDTIHAVKGDRLWVSTDAGRTFQPNSAMERVATLYGKKVGTTSHIYVIEPLNNGRLFESHDGGKSFSSKLAPHGHNGVYNLLVDDVGTIYIAGSEGLTVSQDGGQNYRLVSYDPAGEYFNISESAGKVYYFCRREANRILVTSDHGTSFDTLEPFFSGPLEPGTFANFAFAKANKVYVGNINPTLPLYLSDDSGLTFNAIHSAKLQNVFVTPNPSNPSNPIIYCSTIGGLYISTDRGKTYARKSTNSRLPHYNVLTTFAVGNKIYAGTADGLGISRDGGATFVPEGLGLRNRVITGLSVSGNRVFAATQDGLAYSFNDGQTFLTNYTTANTNGGFRSNIVRSVFVAGTSIFAGTQLGLSISHNNGGNFTAKTTANGLGGDRVNSVVVVGNTVYAGTDGGLSISYDKGNTFENRTVANGLGSNMVNSVYVIGKTVYAATSAGLGISVNGGVSFTNMTTANGLGSNDVQSVTALGYTVYAATANGLSFCKAASLPTESSDDVAARMTFETLETDPKAYSVYPNPVTGNQFNVVVDDPEKAEVSLSATNGQSVPIRKIGTGGKERELQLEATSKLNPGIYLLRVKEGDKARTHQLLVPAVAN